MILISTVIRSVIAVGDCRGGFRPISVLRFGMIVRSAGDGMIVRSAGGGMIVRSAEESDELLDEFPLVVVESVDPLLFRTTFLVLAIYQ